MKKFRYLHLLKSKFILIFCILFPLPAFAHLISITANSTFPATVNTGSSYTASFTVTNISKISITAVNESSFPKDKGISVSSSTCGNLMAPGQSCIIQLILNAPNSPRFIQSALKIWAKPSADGVQYPLNFNVIGVPEILLVPMSNAGLSSLPPLRDPVVAVNDNKWLIVSGSSGNFHNFDYNVFNKYLYVFDPRTTQLYSLSIASTNLPSDVVKQLASSDLEYIQDGDTLYIIGGLHNDTSNTTVYTTLQTVTAMNVPGLMNAVINGMTDLSAYVQYRSALSLPNPAPVQFKVTGGQLGKIGNNFYLVFGQDCEESGGQKGYCTPIYNNSIYQVALDPTLSATNFIQATQTHPNTSWRRRDYTLAPFMLGNTEALFALGGPFTPNVTVWTNGITITEDLQTNDNFIINQKANQYEAANLPMYSRSNNFSYVATFGGLSNLYWSTKGLVYDGTTPFGNILDVISRDAVGNVQEFVNLKPVCSGNPLNNCLYMGLLTKFIPMMNYFDGRGILQLDQLHQDNATLVGYLYGGLASYQQEIFTDPIPSPSFASNAVFAVYVIPAGTRVSEWQNVTNFPTSQLKHGS